MRLAIRLTLLACGVWLALPAQGGVRYGEAEVGELVEIATSETQPEARRARAIRELARTDVRSHAPALRRMVRQERSLDIRLAAACTLVALGDHKSGKDLLLAAAYDQERTPNCSRTDVLLALGRTRDPAAEFHLARVFTLPVPEDEPNLREEACRALGMLGTPGARRLLKERLRLGEPGVRYAAVHPLTLPVEGKVDAEAAALLRITARTDPDERVASQAMSALLWNGVAGPAFFELLERDPDPRVRARAATAMNRHYLSPSRLARLRGALARESDPEVRRAMERTLQGQARPTGG